MPRAERQPLDVRNTNNSERGLPEDSRLLRQAVFHFWLLMHSTEKEYASMSQMRNCPSCGRKVLSLITDAAKAQRYCYHCIPDPESCPGAVFVTRKMDGLYAAGKLETYPLEERIRDLNNPPRCAACGVAVDGEVCGKCGSASSRVLGGKGGARWQA